MSNILDLKDRKILYELDINSRQSNSAIAHKVRLSKDVVNYRIKDLEDRGFIRGYYSIIDFSRLGYFSVRVYIKFLDVTLEKEREMIEFLKNNKKVLFVARTYGFSDITFGQLVKSIYDFERFYDDFKKRFKEHIDKEKIAIYTRVSHYHRSYLLDKKYDDLRPEKFGDGPIIPYDDNDVNILKLIAENCRMPLVELSKRLKMPPRTIAYRIKNLEKNKIIQGYRFIFGFELLSYKYYKVDLMLKNISRIEEIRNYCRKYSNIINLSQSIGGADIEIFLEVKDNDQFIEIINDFRKKFPEIRSWEYFEFQKYYKLKYFPEELP